MNASTPCLGSSAEVSGEIPADVRPTIISALIANSFLVIMITPLVVEMRGCTFNFVLMLATP
jgi:hypothetical protein